MSDLQAKPNQISITSDQYTNGIPSKDGNEIFEISIKGKHNLFNADVQWKQSHHGIDQKHKLLKDSELFKNLPHRLESCGDDRWCRVYQ
jgi:UDP-N-acetylmuramoylalanine-D-glutamate ligase